MMEGLGNGAGKTGRLAVEYDRVLKQRNELYEALRSMKEFMAWQYGDEDPFVTDAEKAMASVTGDTHDHH